MSHAGRTSALTSISFVLMFFFLVLDSFLDGLQQWGFLLGVLSFSFLVYAFPTKKSILLHSLSFLIISLIASAVKFIVFTRLSDELGGLSFPADALGPAGISPGSVVSMFKISPDALIVFVLTLYLSLFLYSLLYKKEEREGNFAKQRPFYVLFMIVITFGLYYLRWLYLLKKDLLVLNSTSKIVSLWLVLLPVIGYIIVVISLSSSYKKISEKTLWPFVILLLLAPIGAPFIQGFLLNTHVKP